MIRHSRESGKWGGGAGNLCLINNDTMSGQTSLLSERADRGGSHLCLAARSQIHGAPVQDLLLHAIAICILLLILLYSCLLSLSSSFPTPFHLLEFTYLSLAKSLGVEFRLPDVEFHPHAVWSGKVTEPLCVIDSQIYKMGMLYIK